MTKNLPASVRARLLKIAKERGGTQLPSGKPVALTRLFAEAPGKRTQWKLFTEKLRSSAPSPELDEVLELLTDFLWPVTRVLQNGALLEETWPPGGPWN